MKRKNQVTAADLSWIAMICTAIWCIYRLFCYITWSLEYNISYIDLILENILMYLPPFVLVCLYFTVLQKKNKAPILLAISFGLIAARHIMDFLFELGVLNIGVFSMLYDFSWVALLLLTLLIVFLLVKFKKKAYAVAAAVGVVTQLHCVISALFSLIMSGIWSVTSYLGWVGTFALYFSILLYATDNNISAHIRLHQRKHSPEQDLLLLQDKLEQGLISEEEYQAQRAEIISKL